MFMANSDFQPELFRLADFPSSVVREQPRKQKKIRRKAAREPRVDHTLFGIAESDAAATKRARAIAALITNLEEIPELIEIRRHDIRALAYFIRRSSEVKLDPNDLDGLGRLVGPTEDLLTARDWQQLRRRKIWREYPPGYLGMRPGSVYPAALHEKEIAYLREMQELCRNEIFCARRDL